VYKIGFAGTPPISINFLEQFLRDPRFKVEFIMTKYEDPKSKAKGLYNHLLLKKYPVKVFTPYSLDELPESIFETISCMIVVAYGHKIPDKLLQKTHWINMHGSLLPEFRGAAPIQYALLNGRSATGITCMLMGSGIDTGPIIDQMKIDISSCDNYGSLAEKISNLSPAWFVETVWKFLSGSVLPREQDHSLATKAPSIKESFRLIEWNNPAINIHNKIRAFSPLPACLVKLNKINIKVIQSEIVPFGKFGYQSEPGKLLSSKDLLFATNDDVIRLTKVIPESRKVMTGEEFCRGFKLEVET